MRVYLAHPWNTFGTDLAAAVEALIRDRWRDATVVNPNEPQHQAAYACYGMDYYVEEVLPGCDRCVFLAFRDGRIGAGVFKEVDFFLRRGRLVWEAAVGVAGEHVVVEGLLPCASVAFGRPLSREETRQRVYLDAEPVGAAPTPVNSGKSRTPRPW